jgi:hypothetical protein
MALSEFVTPVLSIAGPAALVLAILRLGPDAVLRLLAGTVAVLTRDENRGKRCLEVLRILRGRGGEPPGPASQEQSPDGYGAATAELRRRRRRNPWKGRKEF